MDVIVRLLNLIVKKQSIIFIRVHVKRIIT